MKDNFEPCLDHVLASEGGWSDHRDDPGGATMKGVTLITYRRFFGPEKGKEDLRRITQGELAHIYRTGYWDRCRCDDLPGGVDLSVFDGAVNSGSGRSAKWLQAAVGAVPDGVIGTDTLSRTETRDAVFVIHEICNLRLAFLRSLATWSVFGNGWGKRVERVRADSLYLAIGRDPDIDRDEESFETTAMDSRGEWVIRLQNALGIEADGIFGNNTEAALIAWQKENGLEPDGIAGRNTYRALGLIP